jgi:hypothetical protein
VLSSKKEFFQRWPAYSNMGKANKWWSMHMLCCVPSWRLNSNRQNCLYS